MHFNPRELKDTGFRKSAQRIFKNLLSIIKSYIQTLIKDLTVFTIESLCTQNASLVGYRYLTNIPTKKKSFRDSTPLLLDTTSLLIYNVFFHFYPLRSSSNFNCLRVLIIFHVISLINYSIISFKLIRWKIIKWREK